MRESSAPHRTALIEFGLEPIFVSETVLQHIELQSSDNPDNRLRTVDRREHLHDALFRHLEKRFLELLRLDRIFEADAAQNFRRKTRNAEEGDVFAFGKRITNTQRSPVRNADHVARESLFCE